MFGVSIKNRHKKLSSNNIAKVLAVVLLFVVSFSISLVFNVKDFSKTTWNKDATDGNIGIITNDDAFSSDVKMVVEKSDDAEIVMFREVNTNDRAAQNRASATITLENGNDRTATDDVVINAEIKGAAIVHYYLSGTTTSIKDDLRLSGLVGDEFTVSVVEINGYELVSSAPAKIYRYATDTQEIVFEYTKVIPPSPVPTPDNPVTGDNHIPPISLATLPLIAAVIIVLWRNGRRRA